MQVLLQYAGILLAFGGVMLLALLLVWVTWGSQPFFSQFLTFFGWYGALMFLGLLAGGAKLLWESRAFVGKQIRARRRRRALLDAEFKE